MHWNWRFQNELLNEEIMKTAYRLMMIVVMVAVVMSCHDRAAEKRIAELESRLAQIENKSATPTATPLLRLPPPLKKNPMVLFRLPNLKG